MRNQKQQPRLQANGSELHWAFIKLAGLNAGTVKVAATRGTVFEIV